MATTKNNDNYDRPLVECDNCGTETPFKQIEKGSCPDCGEQVLNYIGPSRGGAAEMLANDVAGADNEEQRDVFHALLHFLACGLLDKRDISSFYHFHSTDQARHVFWQAVQDAEELEDSGDKVLVCPSCDKKIDAWAHWFDPRDERGEFFASEEVEGDA